MVPEMELDKAQDIVAAWDARAGDE